MIYNITPLETPCAFCISRIASHGAGGFTFRQYQDHADEAAEASRAVTGSGCWPEAECREVVAMADDTEIARQAFIGAAEEWDPLAE